METRGLRVLLFQKLPGIWVARGLEHDLAVEGRTPELVIDRIQRLVRAHAAFDYRHGRAPLSPFPAAPPRFWRAFERASLLPTYQANSEEGHVGPITIAVSSEDPRRLISGVLEAPSFPPVKARHIRPRRRHAH
jgi:hypothetical protein